MRPTRLLAALATVVLAVLATIVASIVIGSVDLLLG